MASEDGRHRDATRAAARQRLLKPLTDEEGAELELVTSEEISEALKPTNRIMYWRRIYR